MSFGNTGAGAQLRIEDGAEEHGDPTSVSFCKCEKIDEKIILIFIQTHGKGAI